MMPRSASAVQQSTPTLARSHGLLLLLLGGIVLTVLLLQTEYHRARLAAEVLGIALGSTGALLVFGLSRPSPQVVTRAYVMLSRQTRMLLIAGMALLFGFAIATSAIRRVAPQLRNVPGLGGIVTLDWVSSLTMLAVAGSTLMCVGLMAIVARASKDIADDATADGASLERLWRATNAADFQAFRACFALSGQGERLCRTWADFAGPLGGSQVVLVRSAATGGRTWSEWYACRDADRSIRRWVLVASEHSGRISGDGEIFQYVSAEAGTSPFG
jgi:hypothetical protein